MGNIVIWMLAEIEQKLSASKKTLEFNNSKIFLYLCMETFEDLA